MHECSALSLRILQDFPPPGGARSVPCTQANCMRKIEYNALLSRLTSQLYAKNRIQCAAASSYEPYVCEKSNTMRCCLAKRANCMRKIEYNALRHRQTSQLYAKNRIQCAAASPNDPIVCEKSNISAMDRGNIGGLALFPGPFSRHNGYNFTISLQMEDFEGEHFLHD